MPELLDPLGWRTRVPFEESEGVAEPFRGKVLEDPGRFREADESGRWKLGVRRMDIGVFGPVPPSKTFESAFQHYNIRWENKALRLIYHSYLKIALIHVWNRRCGWQVDYRGRKYFQLNFKTILNDGCLRCILRSLTGDTGRSRSFASMQME